MPGSRRWSRDSIRCRGARFASFAGFRYCSWAHPSDHPRRPWRGAVSPACPPELPRMLMLKEEHHQVRDMVRRFSEDVVAPRARELDETETFPHEAVKQMAELGLLGLPYPEKYGGAGMDTLSYAIAVEEVARVCASTAITLAAHVSLGCGPVYGSGTEEQKMKFLVPMAKGDALGAFGLTEPNAGSDAAGTQTRAVKQGECYKVNG